MQATFQVESVSGSRASSPAASARPKRRIDPLARVDAVVGASLGSDFRMLYGLAVPMLVVVGLIVALVKSPSYALVAAALVPELALLLMVVVKILKVLDDSGDEDTLPPAA